MMYILNVHAVYYSNLHMNNTMIHFCSVFIHINNMYVFYFYIYIYTFEYSSWTRLVCTNNSPATFEYTMFSPTIQEVCCISGLIVFSCCSKGRVGYPCEIYTNIFNHMRIISWLYRAIWGFIWGTTARVPSQGYPKYPLVVLFWYLEEEPNRPGI